VILLYKRTETPDVYYEHQAFFFCLIIKIR
jgi:hypothetical protein